MKKADLINRMAAKGYTKKDSSIIITDVFKVITEALVDGEEVNIHGFGTFGIRTLKARNSMDVTTGQCRIVPEHKGPKFSPGTFLKKVVKEGFIRE